MVKCIIVCWLTTTLNPSVPSLPLDLSRTLPIRLLRFSVKLCSRDSYRSMFQATYPFCFAFGVARNPYKSKALCIISVQGAIFYGEEFQPLAQLPSYRTVLLSAVRDI
jgi:hypothetical protein